MLLLYVFKYEYFWWYKFVHDEYFQNENFLLHQNGRFTQNGKRWVFKFLISKLTCPKELSINVTSGIFTQLPFLCLRLLTQQADYFDSTCVNRQSL